MPLIGSKDERLECETERSSISTTSTASSTTNGTVRWTSNSAMKLSKFGKRLRESCRNLKGGKQDKRSSHNPEDYTSFQLPNESVRSKVYVPMDFSGQQGGRILDNPKDVRGCDKTCTKDGYVPFKRRVAAPVKELLTETQASIHKAQPWFHGGMSRDMANKILVLHANTDGVFLVRESSVAGGYVISYTYAGKHFHSQVLPATIPEGVVYSIDDGKTKFYDLLQLVEFYQLNQGTLPTRLRQYILNPQFEAETPTSSEGNQNGASNGWAGASPGASSSGCGKARQSSPAAARPDTPEGESIKMAASSASEAGDSAMSQDGTSEDEASSREQQG